MLMMTASGESTPTCRSMSSWSRSPHHFDASGIGEERCEAVTDQKAVRGEHDPDWGLMVRHLPAPCSRGRRIKGSPMTTEGSGDQEPRRTQSQTRAYATRCVFECEGGSRHTSGGGVPHLVVGVLPTGRGGLSDGLRRRTFFGSTRNFPRRFSGRSPGDISLSQPVVGMSPTKTVTVRYRTAQ